MVEVVRIARRIARNSAMAPFIAAELFPGVTVADDQLVDVVESAIQGYDHPTASAPMGRAGDENAVVGAVHGLPGLHVVDASIIPRVPSVATNLTTIMLAERISSQLRRTDAPDRRSTSGIRPIGSSTMTDTTGSRTRPLRRQSPDE